MRIDDMLTEEHLKNKVNEYVDQALKHFTPKIVRGPKVIHDSVHGTNIFQPYEIAFLDLPIIQRLRRISQTDVSSFVFPAGNHNRFEHTVGVTAVAGLMVDSIFLKTESPLVVKADKVRIYHHCRIAAILHDCGHGPFSHLSEQVYAPQFSNIKKSNSVLKGASPHEIFSYFIAKSEALESFNQNIIKKIYNIDIDLNFVANMIVGYIDKTNAPEDGFAVEIINGAFDADKLDYILRDAHSTGLKMALDLPRLMYTLDVILDENDVSRLAIDISGVAALEEIIFNKMMLTSTIYHHHKVRSSGCLLKGVFRQSSAFTDPTVYLNYTDDQVYNLNSSDTIIKDYLTMLKNRTLPKRAFCFSSRTLDDVTKQSVIMEKLSSSAFINDVIENICYICDEQFGQSVPLEYVWIDSPVNPKFKEATHCIIKSEGSPNNRLILRDVFPTDDWVRAFSENKWQGFVYTTPEYCDIVSKASKIVFETIFSTKFNDFSVKLCKIK